MMQNQEYHHYDFYFYVLLKFLLHKLIIENVNMQFILLRWCFQKGSALRKTKYLVEEIKIQYCYPRLDVNVTKGFNHLLKSPFSIHPKTGKVSVVFKPSNAKNMKLDEIPTIYSLLDDSSPNNVQHQNNMRSAVKHFQEVVFSLEKAEAMRRRNDASKLILAYLLQLKANRTIIFTLCYQSCES